MAYPYFKRWERLVLLVSVYTMYTGISPASWSCYSFSACFMLFAKHHAMNFTWGCNISAFSDQDTLDCVSFCLFIDRYYYCLLVAVHSSTFVICRCAPSFFLLGFDYAKMKSWIRFPLKCESSHHPFWNTVWLNLPLLRFCTVTCCLIFHLPEN